MLYARLDAHKTSHHAIVCAEDGNVLKEGRIRTCRENLYNFFSDFEEVKMAVKVSINYEYIFDSLESEGRMVIPAHPLRIRALAESRINTVEIDVRTLADLLKANFLPTSYIPSKDIRDLHHFVRRRIFLDRLRVRLKNRIHTELIHRGLRYEDGKRFTRRGMALLRALNMLALITYLSTMESLDLQITTVLHQSYLSLP